MAWEKLNPLEKKKKRREKNPWELKKKIILFFTGMETKKNYKQSHHNKYVVADIWQHKQNKNVIDEVIEESGAWFSLPVYEKMIPVMCL